jgi:hypothetical protein
LIVVVDMLAVFAVGKFSKISVVDHFRPLLLPPASIRKVDQRGPFLAKIQRTPR